MSSYFHVSCKVKANRVIFISVFQCCVFRGVVVYKTLYYHIQHWNKFWLYHYSFDFCRETILIHSRFHDIFLDNTITVDRSILGISGHKFSFSGIHRFLLLPKIFSFIQKLQTFTCTCQNLKQILYKFRKVFEIFCLNLRKANIFIF